MALSAARTVASDECQRRSPPVGASRRFAVPEGRRAEDACPVRRRAAATQVHAEGTSPDAFYFADPDTMAISADDVARVSTTRVAGLARSGASVSRSGGPTSAGHFTITCFENFLGTPAAEAARFPVGAATRAADGSSVDHPASLATGRPGTCGQPLWLGILKDAADGAGWGWSVMTGATLGARIIGSLNATDNSGVVARDRGSLHGATRLALFPRPRRCTCQRLCRALWAGWGWWRAGPLDGDRGAVGVPPGCETGRAESAA